MSSLETVRIFIDELWNRRNLELADRLIAPDCHTHQLRSGVPVVETPRGPAAIKAHISEWLVGFPDLQFVTEQVISEGDRVVTQLAMNGTHKGIWLGIPATGKPVNIRMITIHRMRNGQIIEDWVLVESLGLFQQLGILPPTPVFLADFSETHPGVP